MTATTTTTIRGVSIFSRPRTDKTDVFDITLSPEGIVIRRPGRVDQHMTWDRITGWETAERQGCVVLTLRGDGSVTPLMVQGWTIDDLETVMREAAPTEAVRRAGSAPSRSPQRRPTAPACRRRSRRSVWKPLVVIVLLGLLATAVALVLLQSAGVINWGFLGPTV